MNKENVRELAVDLRCASDEEDAERMITEWLEQNQPEPMVVGLSGEHIKDLACVVSSVDYDDFHTTRYDVLIQNWLKTQTFTQPEKFTPSWDDAPSWANWLAQDSDGQWQWYNKKPVAEYGCWASHQGNYDSARGTIKNWKETLQQRPKPIPVVQAGQVWQYKGNEYTIKFLSSLKSGNEWVESVNYISENSGLLYTRTLSDFLEKFERVS